MEQVELVDVNPLYANARHPDGRESTVAVRDLAPCPDTQNQNQNVAVPDVTKSPELSNITKSAELPNVTKSLELPNVYYSPELLDTELSHTHNDNLDTGCTMPSVIRRSTRVSRSAKRYGWD